VRGATPFAEAIFQDDPVTRPGRVLARRLGERAAQFSSAQPGVAQALLAAGKARYFPELSAQAWAEAVLAAAVRAYVPLLDPHGAWAPFDEEWSLYAEDPGFDGSPRLWGEVTRTAVGVRVLSEALSPLENGDLVLSVDGVPTAGMPLEQIEQLGRLEPQDAHERRVLALHGRDQKLSELLVNVTGHLDPGDPGDPLDGERIRFGGGHVLVVRIPDVPEGLGESLGRLIAENRDASLLGVVLDLRGNGGGSTEAAADVLGLFLPGAPLFPLATRGRLVEVMRAPEPEPEQRYTGPVAAIVDGYTASAAEMIAGALSAYGRGVLLGRRTFGKGCIQEYADDHTGRGVLRVTTLLYALPNGSAVQRAGLLPDVLLPVGKARDREADVGGALPGYTGPDVRDLAVGQGPVWPQHRGDIGHAGDLVVTSALRRLGAPPITARALAARRSNSRTSTAAIAQRP
jgi:carboxyl-terminal processing protease